MSKMDDVFRQHLADAHGIAGTDEELRDSYGTSDDQALHDLDHRRIGPGHEEQ